MYFFYVSHRTKQSFILSFLPLLIFLFITLPTMSPLFPSLSSLPPPIDPASLLSATPPPALTQPSVETLNLHTHPTYLAGKTPTLSLTSVSDKLIRFHVFDIKFSEFTATLLHKSLIFAIRRPSPLDSSKKLVGASRLSKTVRGST